MMIILNESDLNNLKPTTRADLMAAIFRSPAMPTSPQNHAEGYEWEDVVDLTPEDVAEFMQGCSTQTVAGLQLIAEHGPVIAANLLQQAGIDNYGHFQGRVTKRTRTITGNKRAFLFTWDDWNSDENAERGCGHYAVTETTFRSLRSYFNLD